MKEVPKVTLFLKNQRKDGKWNLYFTVKRIRFSSGIAVRKSALSKEGYFRRSQLSEVDYDKLIQLKKDLESMLVYSSAEDLKEAWKKKLIKPEAPAEKISDLLSVPAWKALEDFRKKNLSEATLSKYKYTAKRLKSFNEMLPASQLNNPEVVDQFVDYLLNKHINPNTGELGISPVSAWNYLKCIISFINDNLDFYRSLQVKNNLPRSEKIAYSLTKEELSMIEAADFAYNSSLYRTKMFLLAGVHIGARYSELVMLTEENIIEENNTVLIAYLPVKKPAMQKIDPVYIPISSKLQKYLDEIKSNLKNLRGHLLPPIPLQDLNVNLKALIKELEINRKIKIAGYENSRYTVKSDYLYNQISSHVIRKTHTTLSLESGIPMHVVMKNTGRNDSRSMRPYMDLTEYQKRKQELDNLY